MSNSPQPETGPPSQPIHPDQPAQQPEPDRKSQPIHPPIPVQPIHEGMEPEAPVTPETPERKE